MRVLFISILIMLFNPLFSQELIFNSTPQRGIYKNFYEFKYNRPSIEFEYDIILKPVQTLYYGSYIFYGIGVDKKDTLLPTDMFGFCFGESVYLNLAPGHPVYHSFFAKLEFLGRYCIFKTLVDGGLMQSSYFVTNILDVMDGDKFPLTATNVDDLIKDDPELLELYQDERNKEGVAIDYVIKYCERNFSRHIIKPLVNDSTICKLDSDSSFQVYYQRIIDFRIDTSIIDVELREYYYGKSKLKMIGLKAKHSKGKNEAYYYKIGTWRTFYKNGNLKSVENYDFREKKNGESVFYDELGNIKGHKVYLHGEFVR